MLDRKFLLGTTVIAGLAAAALVAPTVALAQSTAPATTTATAADEDEDEDGDVSALVITGSRIKRNEFSSPAPIQVITSEQSSLEGLVDTTDILQQSTLASGSFQTNNQLTGFIVSGGPGGNSISLRGLGEQRTLVLLNGRRAGPAGVSGRVGPFDLNVIPSSLIDRVEILKDGASSIYGSDAIAGVVNIITKTNLDGIEVNAYGNQSFEGGGEQYRINGAWGKTFDRGYVNVGADYYELKGLARGDRDDTACAADYLINPLTGKRIDYRGLDGNYKCYNLTNNYISTTTWGNITPTQPGITYPTAAQGNIGAGGAPLPAGFQRFSRAGYPSTYPYAPTETPLYDNSTVLSPVKRYTLSANGGFDITPNLEVFGEFLYNRRESEQIGVAQIFQNFAQRNTLFGAPNALPASNPNNPFGQNVTTVTAYKSASYQEVDYYRLVGGLRGSIPIMGGWDWEIYGQYSKSDATYNNGDRVYLDRFLATNSPLTTCTNSPLGGNFSGFDCADLGPRPEAPLGGIPWADPRILAGNFSAAERDFLFFSEESTTTYDHAYIEGSLSGDLFKLPAGPVGAAVGFQVRGEKIDDKPGEQAINRNMALFSSAGQTKGDDTVKELFAEFSVPLVKGVPGIENLDLSLSGRYSDYDSYGSSKTYKAGLNWQIVPAWRIRLTQGTSFRAPALYEQFLGAQTGYLGQASVDPCYSYGLSGVSGNVAANCASQGIPDDKIGGSSVAIFSVGGAGVVGPETALARTLGVIWTPGFIDLSVAIDYFDFHVKDEVRQFGAANILNQCYDVDPADFGNSAFCSLFTRDPTSFDLLTVDDAYVNVAEQRNRGLDLTIRYGHEFDFGRLTIDSQFTWQLQDTTSLLATAGEIDYNGSTTEPDFTGQLNFRFDRGDWTVFYGIDMIGKTSDTELFGGDVFPNSRYADLPNGINSTNCAAANSYCTYYKQYAEFTSYHDMSIRKRMDDWTMTAGIQNLFDERPPAQSAGQFKIGTAALNLYDMVGRRAFISISKKW
jgi:iron complex outermembrane receptor protein